MSHHTHAYYGSKMKRRRAQGAGVEDQLFTIASLGTIVSGIFACFASVAIGLSLIVLGSMVLSEINAY